VQLFLIQASHPMQTASATALRPQRTRTLSCPFIYASLAL